MTGRWQAFGREFGQGGWRAILSSAIGYAFGMTVLPFYTLGAFVEPLEKNFGWSRAEVQASLLFVIAGTLAGAWGTGWLIDRFGVKPIAACSQTGLGITLILLGLTPARLDYWYLIWFLMTVIGMGTSPISWTRSVAAWFDGGRGMALALALSGAGLCPVIAPAAATLMIEHQGWRFAYFGLGGSVLLVALPVTLLLMPRDPRQTTGPSARGSDAAGVPIGEALADRRFWILLVSLMCAGFAISGLIPNLMPLMIDRGIAPVTAASLFGVLGIAIIGGRLITGYLLDRLWAPLVACMAMPLPAVGCLILTTGVSDPAALAACVAVIGMATGAEFDLAPYLVTRYFGMKRYSQIYALQWIGFTIAGGLAPPLAGYIHDVTGSYDLALQISALLFILAPALLLLLGPYPQIKLQVGSSTEPA